MNSYAIYRIAETLRVLLFMTLSILVFNFYPVTAVMIVMLALLNDGAILSIAYDNVHYKDQPEAWNMRMVLGISTVLGIIGVVAAFGLFYLGERVFNIDRDHIQTLMYLKLSVAGHLTIFLTRTRGRFWTIRPARVLLIAVFGTQVSGHVDRRLWAVHDAVGLGLGAVRLGLRAGVVPRERPGQSARVSATRSCQGRTANRGATKEAGALPGQGRIAIALPGTRVPGSSPQPINAAIEREPSTASLHDDKVPLHGTKPRARGRVTAAVRRILG